MDGLIVDGSWDEGDSNLVVEVDDVGGGGEGEDKEGK